MQGRTVRGRSRISGCVDMCQFETVVMIVVRREGVRVCGRRLQEAKGAETQQYRCGYRSHYNQLRC